MWPQWSLTCHDRKQHRRCHNPTAKQQLFKITKPELALTCFMMYPCWKCRENNSLDFKEEKTVKAIKICCVTMERWLWYSRLGVIYFWKYLNAKRNTSTFCICKSKYFYFLQMHKYANTFQILWPEHHLNKNNHKNNKFY